MLPSELISIVRDRLLSTVGKPEQRYWSDYELLVDYGNIALDKLFLGARKLITDSNTASDLAGNPLCTITLVANQSDYDVSPKIIEIAGATLTDIIDTTTLDTRITPMRIMTTAEMDEQYYGWRSYGVGNPRVVIIDSNTDSLGIWPVPVANDNPPPSMLTTTVSLKVHRFMLNRLRMINKGGVNVADDSVTLEFREEYHAALIPGILAEAYMKDNQDIKRPELAEFNRKKFEAKIEDIKDDLSRRTRVNRGIRTKLAFR